MQTRTPLTSTSALMLYSSCFPEPQAAPSKPVGQPLVGGVLSFRHTTYELRRGSRPTLCITRRFLCCCLDLPLKELGYALGISFTTVKKLRTWSGLPCWPRRSIQVGKFPFLSFDHIQALRRQYMDCLVRGEDAPLLDALQRVDRLVRGLPLEQGPPTRPPSPALNLRGADAPPAAGLLSAADALTDDDLSGLPLFTDEELDRMCVPYSEPARPDPDAGLLCPWGGSSLLPPV